MPKRTSEGYGHVATEEPYMSGAEVEQAQGNGSPAATQAEVVKLLTAILTQVRNEGAFHPRPMDAAVQKAIDDYARMADAMNPRQPPIVTAQPRA
jgi:hypothetical protein